MNREILTNLNHNQDIDDGIEEYLEAEQRRQDEALYRVNPRYFDWLAELGQFTAERVHDVSLTGVKVEGQGRHPFCYWSGSAIITGIYEGAKSTLKIDWDQSGAILNLKAVPLES